MRATQSQPPVGSTSPSEVRSLLAQVAQRRSAGTMTRVERREAHRALAAALPGLATAGALTPDLEASVTAELRALRVLGKPEQRASAQVSTPSPTPTPAAPIERRSAPMPAAAPPAPPSNGRSAAPRSQAPRPLESEADRTKSLGDFVRCVVAWQRDKDPAAAERLEKVYRTKGVGPNGNLVSLRALSGTIGTAGGFALPEQNADQILSIPPEVATVADGVRVVRMAAAQRPYPVLRATGTPAGADTALVGGIRTSYKRQTLPRTESDPAFDCVDLTALDALTAYTEASSSLVEDMETAGLDDDFVGLLRMAIAARVDRDFSVGSGIGEPLGMFHPSNPALLSVTRLESGHISYGDACAMVAKFLPYGWSSARWVTSPSGMADVGQMRDDAGDLALVSDGTRNGVRLLGIPVRVSEFASSLGTAGDLNLVAPSCYLQGVREPGVVVSVSNDYLFRQDMTAFKVALRHDGRPWLKGPVTLLNGDVASPFVRLV